MPAYNKSAENKGRLLSLSLSLSLFFSFSFVACEVVVSNGHSLRGRWRGEAHCGEWRWEESSNAGIKEFRDLSAISQIS
jgi:hypothetical protein